jgi:hypothetical protein
LSTILRDGYLGQGLVKLVHSALADRTPAEFAAVCSGGNDGDKAALENASRFPHSHREATAGSDLTYAPVSKLLLETIT